MKFIHIYVYICEWNIILILPKPDISKTSQNQPRFTSRDEYFSQTILDREL